MRKIMTILGMLLISGCDQEQSPPSIVAPPVEAPLTAVPEKFPHAINGIFKMICYSGPNVFVYENLGFEDWEWNSSMHRIRLISNGIQTYHYNIACTAEQTGTKQHD